jgi:hypothetical protein
MSNYKLFGLSFLLLCVIASSCSSSRPEDEEEGVTTIRLPGFPKTWKESDTLLYSDIFSEMRYVPLLCHPDVRLNIFGSKTMMLPHQEMIVFSDHTRQIVRFDSTGHYLNHIGCVGKASNEYASPIDVTYDRFNNRVIVFDNPGYLYFYRVDGTFINKVHIPWYIGNLSVLDKDRLVIEKPIGDGKGTCDFCVITDKGEVVFRYLPYENPDNTFGSRYQFFQDGDKNYCHKMGSNVVYEVLQDTLMPAFRLVAPGQKFDWMKEHIKRKKEMEERLKEHDVRFLPVEVEDAFPCQYFTKMGNFYYFTVTDNVSLLHGLYDARTMECKLYGSLINDWFEYVPLPMSTPKGSSQGYQVTYYTSMPGSGDNVWDEEVPDSIRQKFPLELVDSSFFMVELCKWKE